MDPEYAQRMAGILYADEAGKIEYVCAKALGWEWGQPRPEALPPSTQFITDHKAAVAKVIKGIPNYVWCKALVAMEKK